jgi:hypothetical protein
MTPRPLWRRLLRWALRLVLVAVGVRLLLALFLTQLIALAAPWLGLRVEVRSAWLSLSGMSLRLQDVVAADADRPGAPPLFRAGEVALDLSVAALLRGELVVDVGAVAQAHVHLERRADGRVLLPAAWTAGSPVVVHAPATTAPITTLRLPLQVRALRLHDLALTFVDHAATPARTDQLVVDVAVRDLGDPHADGNVAVRIHAPDALDAGWLRATLHNDGRSVRAQWHADLRDVRTARLAAAVALPPALARLQALGAEVRGELRLELRAPGELAAAGNATAQLFADGVERAAVAADFGPVLLAATARTVPFQARVRAAGIADEIALVDAELDHRDAELSFRGRLRAEGVTLAAVRPWLAARGVDWPTEPMSATAAIDASFGAALSLALRDVAVRNGAAAVTAPLVAVQDLRFDDEGLVIEAIDVVGPTGDVARRADGRWSALGVAFAPPQPAAAADAGAPPPQPATWSLPAARLGALRWRGAKVAVAIADAAGDVTVELADVTLRGSGLALGVHAPPGQLDLQAVLPGLAANVSLAAKVTTTPTDCRVAGELAVDGLTLAALRPWLLAAGVAPTWRDAALRAEVMASVHRDGDATACDAALAGVRLADGDDALLQCARATVVGFVPGANGAVGTWTIDGPEVVVDADADGAVRAIAGVPLPRRSAPAVPPAAPTVDAAAALPVLPVFPVVAQQNGFAVWRRAGAPPRRIEFQANLSRAQDAATQKLLLTVKSPGAFDELSLAGEFEPDGSNAVVQLRARGVRGAGLAAVLPPGANCLLADGAIELAGRVRRDGPTGFVAEALRLGVRDGDREWFDLDDARLDVATATADAVHVRELKVAGLRGIAEVGASATAALGWRFAPSPAAPGEAADAAPRAAVGGVRLPRLRIDAAVIDVARFEVRREAAPPVVVAGKATLAPWDASTPERLATPAQWTIALQAPPLLRQAALTATVTPFALQPEIDATIRAEGIDLTQAVPGGVLTDAEFTTELHARLNLRRRDPQRFDLDRPFGGELALDGVRLRDAATGAEVASATSIEAIARAIDPATGAVLLDYLTATDLAFDVTRAGDGVRLPGMTISSKANAAAPPTEPAAAASVQATAAPSAAAEFAVEHLSLQGLRTTVRDETTNPPTIVPIADAEIDVHGFSTRAFTEALPIAFDVSLRGGDVPLERRVHAGNLLAGVVGSAARAVTLQGNQHALAPRPLFDEIAVAGRLAFAPFLQGEARANVTAFELTGLRGLAKAGSVEIADGVLDQRVEVELRGPDGVDVRSLQVFRWLSLTEPPGGPISTYLRLPMPLPSVLFLLRNDEDEQRVPIAIHLPARGVKTSDVVDAIAEAFAKVVADAVAGAAARAAGVVTGFFDFLWPKRALPTAALDFAAGDPAPSVGDLSGIADALARDPQLEAVLAHELGPDDLVRAAALATPPPAVVAAHVADLQARRAELERRRPELVADLDALYAAARLPEARRGQETLLANDNQLGALERTLDAALALLGGDTQRAARRRTDAAARALGQARLAAVAAALRAAVPELAAERLVLRTPRGAASADATGGGRVTIALRRRTTR